MKADSRRAWRTIERVASAFAALGLLAWIIGLLGDNSEWLGWIAMGLLAILGLREFMVGSENVAARLDLSFGRDGAKANLDSKTTDTGTSE
jgi:cytochrome c biogenesis protein CcdA